MSTGTIATWWRKVKDLFLVEKGYLSEATHAAALRGLSETILKTALTWVRVAAKKAIDNPAKRAFVIDILIARGVPPSVAATAVELAYQVYQHEVEQGVW